MMTTKTASPSPAAKSRGGKSTREAILDAAMRLMHVHGYHQTSLDDVLSESGVGKGNFYYLLVARSMYIEAPVRTGRVPVTPALALSLLLCVLGVVALGVYPKGVVMAALRVASPLF